MHYTALPPCAELAVAVEGYWAYDGYRPPHARERIFPAGTVEVVLNLTDGLVRCHDVGSSDVRQLQGLVLTGVHRRPLVVDTAQQYSMLGIAFKPGGIWRALGLAGDQFTDTHVEMDAAIGRDARTWVAQVWDAPTHLDKLRVLDAALCRHARAAGRQSHPAVEWATEQLLRYPGRTRVSVLADEAELSTRRFNAVFTREIGVGPKWFARIRRFQATLDTLRRRDVVQWPDLACEMGYADQAHMIREFQEFGGLSPTQYRSHRATCLAHVPEAEADQMFPCASDEAALSVA